MLYRQVSYDPVLNPFADEEEDDSNVHSQNLSNSALETSLDAEDDAPLIPAASKEKEAPPKPPPPKSSPETSKTSKKSLETTLPKATCDTSSTCPKMYLSVEYFFVCIPFCCYFKFKCILVLLMQEFVPSNGIRHEMLFGLTLINNRISNMLTGVHKYT